MLENDKRMSKYHYEDMIDTDDNRKIPFNSNSAIHKFLTNNIPMKVNEVQKSYVVDSLVDSKTNRITKYGNEYIVFNEVISNSLVPNQGTLKYGQYYLPEDFVFGTKWSLIGTEKPTSGRLLIIDDISSELNGTNRIKNN